jgi:hypothetical protein
VHAIDLVAHGVNVFFAGLFIGGLVMESFMILPLFKKSSPSEVVRMHVILSKIGFRLHLPMAVTLDVAGTVAFVLDLWVARTAAWFTLAGIVFAAGGLGVLVLRYLPLGRVVARWEGVDPPPDEYAAVFRRWEHAQHWRTAWNTLDFIAFVTAACLA